MRCHRPVSSRVLFPLALLAILALSNPFLSAADPPKETAKKPFPEVVWKVDKRVPKAQRVFTSPVDPDVAFVSSAQGLWRTRSDARDWGLVPNTDAEALGTVSHLAVCPARPEFVILGSLEKGVFVSDDGGGTWRRAGGVEAGLSGERVHYVGFAREDGSWNTLVACHDTDAPGISRSIDGGRHWRVIAPSRYFRTFVDLGQLWSGASALIDEPDNWGIVRSMSYGEVWHRRKRDVMPTVGASTTVGPVRIVWGSRGSRLLWSADGGDSYEEAVVVPPGRWSSLFVTPGHTSEEQWFWAYDPFDHGLLCGRDFERPWQSHNRGLYVHRMIKRGANVTANANGTRFYACVNGSLYVGEHAQAPDAPVIRRAKADPPVLVFPSSTAIEDARKQADASSEAICRGAPMDVEIERMFRALRKAKEIRGKRRFAVQVCVEHPRGPDAVKKVSVTPDLFGLTEVALFDDGKHRDGKAHDGLWAGEFSFVKSRMWDARRLGKDGRHPFPGVRGIPVTAVDQSGNKTSWTLMLGVFFEPEPRWMWQARTGKSETTLVKGYKEGNVSIGLKKAGGLEGGETLEIKGGKGPWHAYWGTAFQRGGDMDVTPFKYVTFKLRGLPGDGDVSFFLVDELTADRGRREIEAMLPKSFSSAVPLLKDGHLPAMDGKYHEVKMPMVKLVRDIRFMRRHVAGFGLRALEGARGGTYYIDEVRLTHD